MTEQPAELEGDALLKTAILVAAVTFTGGAVAAKPMLIEQRPKSAWKCVIEAKPAFEARLHFFDPPITVDRYSPAAGLDQVEGINVIARTTVDGHAIEYAFGVHRAVAQTYEIAMRFSAVILPQGLNLMVHDPGKVTIMDRNTGEMREAGQEPGSSQIWCISAFSDFENTAKAYHRLILDMLARPPL